MNRICEDKLFEEPVVSDVSKRLEKALEYKKGLIKD